MRLAISFTYPLAPGLTFGNAIIGEVVVSVAPITMVLPTLNLTLNQNGDVTVTFTGTLQTASTVNGTFVDVAGNPQGTYTLPRGILSTERYFRARSN